MGLMEINGDYLGVDDPLINGDYRGLEANQ